MADEDENDTESDESDTEEPEEASEDESDDASESEDEADEDDDDDDDDELLEGDDDESALEGDDELDADEKAMLDEDVDDDDLDDLDDDEDLEVDDEELDDQAAPVTANEQRRAGWGCLVMLIVIPTAVWYGARYLASEAMQLDQTHVPDWFLEAAENDAVQADYDASLPPAPTIEWLTEIDAALERAQDEEKPLVITFVSDEDDRSDRMTHGTWLNRDVLEQLTKVVAVRLDLGDETNTIAQRFEVTSAPTTLFLTPDLERLRPDTARLVDATDMEIYLFETVENHLERRIYRESAPDEEAPDEEAPDEEAPDEEAPDEEAAE